MLKIIQTLKTPEEHKKGLMFAKPLGEDEGVLFAFDSDVMSGFWNKNVFFPIDIAFFDKNGYLINVETVKRNQLLTVNSHKPYRFVIETRKDWFKDHKISEGMSMDLIIGRNLKALGFSKKSAYDPTATHQPPDTDSLYKKVNDIPTNTSIEMLGKE